MRAPDDERSEAAAATAGFLYCFNTLGDPRIYKIGHTRQNDVAQRLKGYLGPSKPRVVVVQRRVDDSFEAEQLCLRLVRATGMMAPRDDLGDEWFEAHSDRDVGALHDALLLLTHVVARAVKHLRVEPGGSGADARPQLWPQFSEEPLDARDDEYPPGHELYVAEFDRYVERSASAAALARPDLLVAAYEESDSCPVFADYLRIDRDRRIRCARARFFG